MGPFSSQSGGPLGTVPRAASTGLWTGGHSPSGEAVGSLRQQALVRPSPVWWGLLSGEAMLPVPWGCRPPLPS